MDEAADGAAEAVRDAAAAEDNNEANGDDDWGDDSNGEDEDGDGNDDSDGPDNIEDLVSIGDDSSYNSAESFDNHDYSDKV